MEVLSIEEQDDGSAIVEISMTSEENDFFVEYAVVDILKKQLERFNNEQGTERNKGKVQPDQTLESEDL